MSSDRVAPLNALPRLEEVRKQLVVRRSEPLADAENTPRATARRMLEAVHTVPTLDAPEIGRCSPQIKISGMQNLPVSSGSRRAV